MSDTIEMMVVLPGAWSAASVFVRPDSSEADGCRRSTPRQASCKAAAVIISSISSTYITGRRTTETTAFCRPSRAVGRRYTRPRRTASAGIVTSDHGGGPTTEGTVPASMTTILICLCRLSV